MIFVYLYSRDKVVNYGIVTQCFSVHKIQLISVHFTIGGEVGLGLLGQIQSFQSVVWVLPWYSKFFVRKFLSAVKNTVNNILYQHFTYRLFCSNQKKSLMICSSFSLKSWRIRTDLSPTKGVLRIGFTFLSKNTF